MILSKHTAGIYLQFSLAMPASATGVVQSGSKENGMAQGKKGASAPRSNADFWDRLHPDHPLPPGWVVMRVDNDPANDAPSNFVALPTRRDHNGVRGSLIRLLPALMALGIVRLVQTDPGARFPYAYALAPEIEAAYASLCPHEPPPASHDQEPVS